MTRGRGSGTDGRVRVAVLFGGESDEHDVSLRSAETVMGALDPDLFEVVPVGITRQGAWLAGDGVFQRLTSHSPLFALPGTTADGRDAADDPLVEGALTVAEPGQVGLSGTALRGVDVVFPVLHGPRGEDGTVQGMLELAGVPYVGSGVLGSAVAMDKAMAKVVLAQAGIPQGPWLTVARSAWEVDPDALGERIATDIGFPCFVKPANMGSSVGVSKVHDAGELGAAMSLACQYDRRIVVEAGLDAREIEVAVLGNESPVASVAGEIVPAGEFYDYAAKYVSDDSELIVPADLTVEQADDVSRLAVAAFAALDLAGLARVDFFVEREGGRVLVNEVNTLPGFTAISMYPRLWEASGMPLPDLVARLVDLAQARHAERRR
ncbi:MAG: D-alanine--D-alanine ligase [uncultured Thermomicrobiales bacterium]|uniref:D-alanine--D-alanine ligase n=1 Tax=uncultured Thermomicrobiales bacterium TaxID=1645740 RepID=A0A6J4UJE9_9BACT|nr:MAG: D-alanine--D-alanine ligase [uncultured Thermomicrobiales bacterium]